MIQSMEISGVHMDVGDDLRKYVAKKIGRLDKYLPRASRASAHAQIKLKEGKAKDKSARTCEIILHVPQEEITVSETTVNIYAAIDIAEEKLKTCLHKYKQLRAAPRIRAHFLAKLGRGGLG